MSDQVNTPEGTDGDDGTQKKSTHEQLMGLLDSEPAFATPDDEGTNSEQDADGDEGDQGEDQGEGHDDQDQDQDTDDNGGGQDQDDDGGEGEEFEQDADAHQGTDLWSIQDEDGKDQQVSGEELRKGYLRQQHFTKVTQQAADNQRVHQAQMQVLAGQQQQYLDALNNLQAQLTTDEFDNVDWTELRTNDPDEYLLLRERKREQDEKVQSIQQQRGVVLQQQQHAYQAQMVQFLAGENDKLSGKDGIDGWKDTKSRGDIQKKIAEYGANAGFSSEELGKLADSRVLKMMHKAALYDEMQSKGKKIAGKKKAKAPVKVVKGGQSKTKREMSAEKKAELKKRSRQTGSTRDAANAFLGIDGF